MRPGRHLVEVAPPQRAALGARENQRARVVSGEGSQVLAEGGDDHVGMPTTRRPALDLGGPRSISPVERSR